jgi:hypothetical protein
MAAMCETDEHGNPIPEGFAESGRRLWVSVADVFELDVHEQLLLTQACRIADILDRLNIESLANPVTVINMKGDRVPHPSLTEMRQQSIVLSRLIASLRMPSGEQEARPQRRGAARGSYSPRSLASVPARA